jgi:hypothetical protein
MQLVRVFECEPVLLPAAERISFSTKFVTLDESSIFAHAVAYSCTDIKLMFV